MKKAATTVLKLDGVTEEVTPETEEPKSPFPELIDSTAMIVTDEDILVPVQLNTANINDGTLYEPGKAYCAYPYYYIYRGLTTSMDFARKLPGIYLTETDHYIWIPVTEGNGDDEWKIDDKFATADSRKIIDILIKSNDIKRNIPENGKVFRQEELESDDILKRVIKRALKAKQIAIDDYKACFSDKNALFNFKQVVKNPNSRLSMLLFERGCHALNLKYTITIEELSPDDARGVRLQSPISICSEDTYEPV